MSLAINCSQVGNCFNIVFKEDKLTKGPQGKKTCRFYLSFHEIKMLDGFY